MTRIDSISILFPGTDKKGNRRIPQLDPVPANLPIGGNWLVPIYNPNGGVGANKTFRTTIDKLPIVASAIAARVTRKINYQDFIADSGNYQTGRVSIITNRPGNGPEIAVSELEPDKIGSLASRINSDGSVSTIQYNLLTDMESAFQGGGGPALAFFGVVDDAIKLLVSTDSPLDPEEYEMRIVSRPTKNVVEAGTFQITFSETF